MYQDALRNQLMTILDRAREMGLTDGELATRALIRPETLSRIKTRGTAEFNTVESLARVVGLKFVLRPVDDVVSAIETGEFFR